MGGLLLEVEGLQKAFDGVPALMEGRLSLRAGSVHALCGGNGAGKSTFLNIVMGIIQRDAGEIRLNGLPVNFQTPAEALANRVAIITQELSPIRGMTVAENLFLGREPRRAKVLVKFGALVQQAQALLDRLGFPVDARASVDSLSLAQIQLVEIAKAFSRDCDVMIMDEPTSAIGESETEVLFSAIRNLTAQGAGIIYVTHRLSEVFRIADSYTVFRDGRYVESGRIADIDRAHLVSTIVGRKLNQTEKVRRPIGEPVLETSALSRDAEFEDISLSVSAGEVLGVYGLMGSGRSEYLNCVYGLTRAKRGEVTFRGRRLASGNPRRAIRAGLALVTEDRKETGLVLSSSVRDNVSLSAYPRLSRFSLIDRRKVKTLVQSMVERMRIKVGSVSLPVSSMSGGNQQKVVLARCLSTEPVCLLCDEPTRGIDEGAKREIYRLLDDFVAKGGAAIVVSSEAQEVLDVSDRIAIFKSGRLVSVIDGHVSSQEDLLHLAS
ncbi:sugar ABC transporter ATP-binding protein [Paraburkholderia sp. DHOC27]|uniref:sugar ABC transporter ATP-binding protein n=1 Tax=Paraburkholderia sp. DHOC27 TaxID=2303330 RepID=UPI000E3B5F40|nr:sugar ABC transporter ATP-binding protein [Paraburkholderia sp. DHOC27]RFU49034.1 sugar ABC transporter ATP-binding protein [Paraburkholderia sp. DHOC27]